jgi:Domain of unknown function (DUF4157)
MSERDSTRRPEGARAAEEMGEASGADMERARLAMAMRRRQIQRKAQAESRPAGGGRLPQSSGAPLDAGVRRQMEGHLGTDLSDVRVHTGSESAKAASDLGARAFTHERDVHFNHGEFAPGTKEGDRLLAHELTHVAQGKAAGAVARKAEAASEDAGEEGVSQPHDPAEREADHIADAVAGSIHGERQGPAGVPKPGAAPPAIHRKAKPDAEAEGADSDKAGAEPGPKDAKKDKGEAKDFSKLTDDERWKEVQEFVKASPTGQNALDLQKKYSIALKWQPGGGSYYDASSKSMVLDSALNAEQVALNFVHEMNHAQFDQEGKGAHGKDKNISTMGREEYVKSMLDEEVEGTCLSIETKMELEAAGQKVSSKYPLEDEYRAAYDKVTGGKGGAKKDADKGADPKDAKDATKDAGSKKDDDAAAKSGGAKAEAKGLDPEGKKAGREAVLKGFQDGKVQTSNTGEKYPDYYGNAWDKANKGKKK